MKDDLDQLLEERIATLEAEEALQQSEEKFRTLFDNATDGILIADPETKKFITGNPAICKMLGYALEEIERLGVDDIHPEKDLPYVTDQFERLLKREFRLAENIPIKRKDGSVFYADIDSFLITLDGTLYLVGIFRDVTERKQAEKALHDSRHMLQTVLDSIPTAVFWKDRDSFYLGGNRTWLEAAGLNSSEEVVGKSDYELPWDKEQADLFREDDRGVMESGIPEYNIIEPYLRADGTPAWAKTTKVPLLDMEGNIVGVLGTYEDITARKQAKEEFKKANEELHRLSTHLETVREKERTFLAREIHDEFGQLLTALKMELSWIGSKLPEEHNALIEKTKSMTQLIDKGIKTVQKISSRLRMGLLDDLGLKEALEREIREFERKTPGIKCETDLNFEDIVTEKELSTTVFRILQEALTNISRHAKATLVKVKLKKENNRLLLKIRDNGIGITKDKIFHKNSFGLMGTRERAFHLGGEVNISGRRNKGTTITVTIPLDKKVDSE